MILDKHNILIVEDDEILRFTLCELLEPYYNIASTDNGESVLGLVERHQPLVIVLDILLSGYMDGFSVLRQLKQDERFKDTPVIFISAYGQESQIQTGISLGANDYIVKPFSAKLLQLKVESLIQLRIAIQNKVIKTELNKHIDPGFANNQLQEFERIIEEILLKDADLSIHDIAQRLNLSVSTFERVIKKAYKMPPNRYILNRRLEKANLLLSSTNLPIKEISMTMGFNSVSYFTKCYKALYGSSPSTRRKK
jgi:YesN/AraC family two-component response regulator